LDIRDLDQWLGARCPQAFATALDEKWQQKYVYYGNAFDTASMDVNTIQISVLKQRPLGVLIEKDELIALKLIGDTRLPVGYLLIVYDSLKPLTKSKLSLLKQILPLTLLVVLIVIVISFLIQQRLFMPLSRLSNLAKKIQKTNDYSLRIDIHGKQEVAELSRDIISMMETINKETEKNKEYTDQLMEQQKTN
jgi:methyl-accepting chemotaxis protein